MSAPDLDQLVSEVRSLAFAQARFRGCTRDDADDVAQEVAIRAFNVIADGGNIDSHRSWVATATRNYIIDLHRKNSRMKAGGDIVETLVDIDESRFLAHRER